MADSKHVVVVGGGVMGAGVAYWLSREGVRVTVFEKESIASGASGVAAAMLNEAFPHDPRYALNQLTMKLHKDLGERLQAESGVDFGYMENAHVSLAFSQADADRLKAEVPRLTELGQRAEWVDAKGVLEVEPQANPDTLGGLVQHQFQVIASRFTLALATAAERNGAEFIYREVTGLTREGSKVTGVRLANGDTVAADAVVLAAGPWTVNASGWTGVNLALHPVRGQILRLEVEKPLRASLSGEEMYIVSKADGGLLAGATEEHEAGFDTGVTPDGLAMIMDAAIKLAPPLANARLVNHVSGLRPGTGDELPLIGAVPGWDDLYVCAGHFRRGMELSAASTKIIADLVQGRPSPIDLTAFDPGRFGAA